uniref:Structural protein n=1 Tax=Geladintestivirus 4 TaxID=3233136 RepID=A0AAU8MHM5_9CAUD
MASINMLVSEIAHSIGQPNNHSLRLRIRNLIIHTRNEIIRRSYENHDYVDKILTQRFRVSLTTVNDGNIELPEEYQDVQVDKIKRTLQKVPRPVRLTNNLPFDRVSSVGYKTNREFPYIKETTARFKDSVPGLCGAISYDYINEYLYLFPSANNKVVPVDTIVIESAFEHPNQIAEINGELTNEDKLYDSNEWLLSEDMIGQIKEIITKRELINQHHETDEVPNTIKY